MKGEKFLGIQFKWDYIKQTFNISMPDIFKEHLHNSNIHNPTNYKMPHTNMMFCNTVPRSNTPMMMIPPQHWMPKIKK